jgi:hypothetical protein
LNEETRGRIPRATQVAGLLRDLKKAGRVRLGGKTKGAIWFPVDGKDTAGVADE